MIKYNKSKKLLEDIRVDEIMNIDIGTKIRSLRKDLNMSIADLAKKTQLSSGIISQIERNMVTPSIVTFWKISNGLGVSVGYFFENDENIGSPVVKKNLRKTLSISNSNAIYELLSPDLNRKIEFLYITLKKGDETTEDLITHEGEECGVVIKGRLLVKTSEKDYLLEEGDSIYFSSTIPHRYINIGKETCESIWAMTPPSF